MAKSAPFILATLLLVFWLSTAVEAKSKSGGCPHLRLLNVMYVLDTSHSLTSKDFAKLKNFANAITKGLRKQGTKADVGVIRFGVNAQTEIEVDNPYSQAELERQINHINFTKEFGTNTHLGLFLARKHLKVNSPCSCSSPKAIVLLTDGYPSYESSAFVEARVARESGIHVFVVAMGEESNFPGASKERLAYTFTNKQENRVVRVEKASQLGNFVDYVIKEICLSYVSSYSQQVSEPLTHEAYVKMWPLVKA